MANTYFEDHPTDPNKVILRKRPCPFCQDKPRTWQGLTDDEICPWFQENTALTNEAAMRITRAIEAKLKEKNNG